MVNARWMVQSQALGVSRVLAGVLALFVALLPFPPGALAADDEDLPLRVGRVADVGGELLLSPQDRPEEWSPIGINYPVASGDNLWVGAEGRAEVDYGAGQFRLAGDTSVNVSRLEDRQLALFVAQGRVIVRLRFRDRDEVATVDTPNTQVQLTRPGLYRIEVSPDRSATTVVVREGEALVAIAGGAQQVLPGQVATASGADPAYADVRSGYGIDGFDAWSADRDRGYERSRSANYVSRQMPGWAELDRYGAWDAHPTYGAIWYPTGSPSTGRRTASAAGPTSAAGAGPGSTTRPGATRLRTTVAGCGSAGAGAGLRGPSSRVRSGRRRWSAGSAGPAGRWRSPPAAPSTAGCRWAGATRTSRGGAAAAADSAAGRPTTVPSRCRTRSTAPSGRRSRPPIRTGAFPAR